MTKLKIGEVLVHPTHGEMKITGIKPNAPDEYIEGEWRAGEIITASFGRFIPAVKWRIGSGKTAISILVFHSHYLKNLKVK